MSFWVSLVIIGDASETGDLLYWANVRKVGKVKYS